jgi:hypothetical protein
LSVGEPKGNGEFFSVWRYTHVEQDSNDSNPRFVIEQKGTKRQAPELHSVSTTGVVCKVMTGLTHKFKG